jgi:hypothetical protein
MKITPKRLMTVSSRCSRPLLLLLVAVMSLRVSAQRIVWSLPQYNETVRVGAIAVGNAFARDTYLSSSRYNGWALGFETDSWSGYQPDRLFRYGKVHSTLLFSPMTNRHEGGSTLSVAGSNHWAYLWPAVECSMCDLLIGPVAMLEMGVLYNQQNSNNPVNIEGYFGAGLCVDNTFRFSLFRYGMALQATLYMPLAGVGFAPDYDQPYWYMYKYGEYGKALHFITPFNNTAVIQQVALVFPIRGDRLRIGYTFDYTGNALGGHSRSIGSNSFTIGYALRFQAKEWGR